MATEQTPLQRIAGDFFANPVAVFGLALLTIVMLTAILAPLISPQNPYDLAQLDVMDVDGTTIDGSARWCWGDGPTRNRQIDPGQGFLPLPNCGAHAKSPMSSGRGFT